jgi:hypothetical protein
MRGASPARTKGPAVADAPFCRRAAARIGVDLELARLGRQDQTRLVVHPLAHFLKQFAQEKPSSRCAGSVSVKSRSSENR